MDVDGTADSCGCKVGDTIQEFGLEGLSGDLADRWTGENPESVRALTDVFNRRVLASALESSGESSLQPDVEATYQLLQGTEGTSGMRVSKRRQLERAAVDIDRVTSQFISHQTLYRHFTGCLGRSRAEPTGDLVSSAVDDVAALSHRLAAVTYDRVERLAGGEALDHEAYRVLVDISLTCERCGTVYGFEDLLDRGGCGCDT